MAHQVLINNVLGCRTCAHLLAKCPAKQHHNVACVSLVMSTKSCVLSVNDEYFHWRAKEFRWEVKAIRAKLSSGGV